MDSTNKRQKLFLTIPRHICFIIIIAGIVRIISAFTLINLRIDYYWEYGEIAKNILAQRGYSLFYFSGDNLSHLFNQDVIPFSSAYMAPGYVVFLLPFIAISHIYFRNVLIVVVQTCFSLLTIFMLYRFTTKYFSERIATITAILACFLPDFIFSAASFTPTILYQLLVIALMQILYSEKYLTNRKNSLLISILFGLLSYIRFEFILFAVLFLLFQALARYWKSFILVCSITITLLSPWIVRNTLVFNHFIPLGTGFGLNFYRGNNPDELGSWGNPTLKKEILEISRNQLFEVSLNKLYSLKALEYIYQNPFQEIQTMPTKLYHIWVFSDIQKRTGHTIYQITSCFVSIFFFIGFLVTLSWQKHKYLYIFYIYSSMIALIFFTMPRHQTMMRIALLPIIGAGIEYVWGIIKKGMTIKKITIKFNHHPKLNEEIHNP